MTPTRTESGSTMFRGTKSCCLVGLVSLAAKEKQTSKPRYKLKLNRLEPSAEGLRELDTETGAPSTLKMAERRIPPWKICGEEDRVETALSRWKVC